MFGFDIIIDQQLKPWILEVNVSPSLNASSPMDKKIKSQLVCQTLELVGFQAYDRKRFKQKQEEEKKERLFGITNRQGTKIRQTLHSFKQQTGVEWISADEKEIIQEAEEEVRTVLWRVITRSKPFVFPQQEFSKRSI